jgi:predicted dehydrogenase
MSPGNRRSFLGESAALLGSAALAGRALAANDRIGVCCIGVRGQGNALLQTFAAQPDVRITHICDIDENIRGQRGSEIEKKHGYAPKLVNDYRTILEDKAIDVVCIGTPDHWHALPAIDACLARKDVYLEKPDGHNINEGKAIVAAARKQERMVQLGTQARSAPDLMEAVKFVAAGNLGKVIYGKAWETDDVRNIGRPADSTPPKGVDYDLWLGPAPKRPFNIRRFHGTWRWFVDYGSGDLGNDGVHRLDFCRWVMGGAAANSLPTAVTCAGGTFSFDDMQEWPDTQIITYEYPGQILTYEMRLWSRPRLDGLTEGAAVYGENGWMLISNNGWKAFDKAGKVMKEMQRPYPLAAHIRNFLDAVKSRKRETLHQEIAQGHASSVLCYMGNIAWRTGKKLKFDARSESFDDAEANQLLGREYRKGFELPTVS